MLIALTKSYKKYNIINTDRFKLFVDDSYILDYEGSKNKTTNNNNKIPIKLLYLNVFYNAIAVLLAQGFGKNNGGATKNVEEPNNTT